MSEDNRWIIILDHGVRTSVGTTQDRVYIVADDLSLYTHNDRDCTGRHCVIHNPSDHRMHSFPLHWRMDRGIFERMCPHGIGHDDPDDIAYRRSRANCEHDGVSIGVHGCDGCCVGQIQGDGIGYIGRPADVDDGVLRTFETGATRDTSTGKLEPWGFTSALVEKVFSEYMSKHTVQSDGSERASDNWTKGIPFDAYWHSLSRHIQDLRLIYEGLESAARTDDLTEVLCAVKFNVDGLIYELAKVGISTAEDDD